jgi:hypothetical protein
LATFRAHLPSKRDILLVFAVCVFPVFSWSILGFLKKVPYWSLFLNAWDLVGAFAYTQIFALLESAVVLLALTVVGAILPAQLFRDRFVAHAGMATFLTAAWLIADEYLQIHVFGNLVWLSLYLISIGVSYGLVYFFNHFQSSMCSFAERLTALLYLYVTLTGVSLMIVILRNL